MPLFSLYTNIFIFIMFTNFIIMQAKRNKSNDIVLLSPVEIVDLVLKERMKNNVFNMRNRPLEITTKNHLKINDCDIETAKLYEDQDALRTRKVWSRWSKWGDCSVTCGSGNICRRRTCVTGHCAPGEIEEQRRPCIRSPCVNEPDSTLIDDLNDLY